MNQGLTIYPAISGDTLLSLQVHQKRPSCPTCDNTFLSLTDHTLPFLFTRTSSLNTVTTFKIKDSNDTVVATLDNNLISILNAGEVDFIVCNFQPIDDELDCDLYYYELIMGTETYYSEIFRVIGKTVEFYSSDIAVNGQFTTDLSGWTVNSASWSADGVYFDLFTSISQDAPGDGYVKVVVNVTDTNSGAFFEFGSFSFPLANGANVFYIPSGVSYMIIAKETDTFTPFLVSSVEIYQAEKVECYNLIFAHNSCNKNGIPYVETGYADFFIVDAELYEPEYPRDDEVDNNGDKDKSQTFMRIDKRWTMQTSNLHGLYEPLIDELVKLPANDCIYIFNDIWKKAFISFEETMDIEVQPEWLFEDKCNASAKLVVTENLVINNSCCEVIDNLTCCESFEYGLVEGESDIWTLTLTEPCESLGVYYSIIVLNVDEEVIAETFFTTSIEIDMNPIEDVTWSVKAQKFGCDTIIYPLNLS